MNPKELRRFCNKIEMSGSCWNWLGSKNNKGYGTFTINNKMILAHRCSYELFKQLIPIGLQIDHLCKNRKCVNPNHLEAVTTKENIKRSDNFIAKQILQTHCQRGHELTGTNLTKNSSTTNTRKCRICINERERIYYWKRKNNKLKQ